MFNRKRNRNRQAGIRTLIDAHTRISGDLAFSGGLHLDGTVIGNVMATDAGDACLSVSEEACIEGNVTVPTVILNGLVKGDIHASESIQLGPRARVVGNVTYTNIETSVGAQINGKLIHQPDSGPAISDRDADALLSGQASLLTDGRRA